MAFTDLLKSRYARLPLEGDYKLSEIRCSTSPTTLQIVVLGQGSENAAIRFGAETDRGKSGDRIAYPHGTLAKGEHGQRTASDHGKCDQSVVQPAAEYPGRGHAADYEGGRRTATISLAGGRECGLAVNFVENRARAELKSLQDDLAEAFDFHQRLTDAGDF